MGASMRAGWRRMMAAALVSALVLVVGSAGAWAKGGSFGGGRSSGGGGRSFGGGGSFGSRPSSGGSFGSRPSAPSRAPSSAPSSGGSFSSSKPAGGGSFGAPRSSGSGSFGAGGSTSSSAARSSSGSFGARGSMGGSSYIRSSSVQPRYYGRTPYRSTTVLYGGSYVPAYHYGYWSGYSMGWMAPRWYYYTPFHPAFYYSPPVYYGGGVYPGSFSFMRMLLGVVALVFALWLITLPFRMMGGGGGGGGGRGPRYTNYSG